MLLTLRFSDEVLPSPEHQNLPAQNQPPPILQWRSNWFSTSKGISTRPNETTPIGDLKRASRKNKEQGNPLPRVSSRTATRSGPRHR